MDRHDVQWATIAGRLDRLHDDMLRAGDDERIGQAHPGNRASAQNLAHYLQLRRHDIRHLQDALSEIGLSSLGASEPHVLASVDAVRAALAAFMGAPAPEVTPAPVDFDSGPSKLVANADALLGQPRNGRRTRILVTLPSEAATDAELVARIIESGAEAVRINCAHDGPDAWAGMIANVRRAERVHGRHVTVTMDLAGPKLRTGPIAAGPQVLKLRPSRDALGTVTAPARVLVTGPNSNAIRSLAHLPVIDQGWVDDRHVGEIVRFRDARGRRRRMRLAERQGEGWIGELDRSAYLVPDTELGSAHGGKPTRVGALHSSEQKFTLRVGDELVLVPELAPVPANARPARIGCTLPQLFTETAPGQRIMFDDGTITGVIAEVNANEVTVRITEADVAGAKLGAAKGINLPDTELDIPALTGADLTNLPFIVAHADALSLSFVRTPDDVRQVQQRLAELGGEHRGLILKIETVSGFQHLPEILFAALRSPRVGVMIARGDLAVEAGFVRLAELQEEILWLCEAAHVPVIWATEVLDILARTGRPSRAEVTDAAMSGRAECVLLNKGPWVDSAVRVLDDILGRMDDHQHKKQSLLRKLHSWGD